MLRWIYMPKRRSRNCCCSSVIDNSEAFPGSSSAEAFPIEAYNAAAARPPVNSLLFIPPAFLPPCCRKPCPGSSLSPVQLGMLSPQRKKYGHMIPIHRQECSLVCNGYAVTASPPYGYPHPGGVRHDRGVPAMLQRAEIWFTRDVGLACVKRRRMQHLHFHRAATIGAEVERQFQVALLVYVYGHHRDRPVRQLGRVGRRVHAGGLNLA